MQREKNTENNITSGSVGKALLYFALPYLLSYFLQTLYGMADLFIIGQFNSVESTTAVSIGGQVMHMLTVMIVGLAMGSTVMIGRAVGAQKPGQASAAIGNTVTLFMIVSIAAMAILLSAVRPIVTVMSTPEEAVPETIAYLTVCFTGIPFITAYNIISSIFRGTGDSKSPMYFIAVACVANIALDYLFIGAFGMGAMGAALGTTLAQTISVAVSLIVKLRGKTGLSLSRKDLKPRRAVMGSLLKVGLPVALQDGFIQISFIVITIFANRRGLNDAAAVGIVEKIIGILFLVPSSMLSSVSALCAQNIGAGKHDRARITLRYAVLLCFSFGIAIASAMQFVAAPMVGLFTDNAEAIRLGSQYMHGYVWDCALAGIHFCFSGYFCAYGRSSISFFHNAVSIVCARIPLAWLASTCFAETLLPMGLASTAGSGLSAVICILFYLHMRRTDRTIQPREAQALESPRKSF